MSRFRESWRKASNKAEQDRMIEKGINSILDQELREQFKTKLLREQGISKAEVKSKSKWLYYGAIAATMLILILALPKLFDQPNATQLASQFIFEDVMIHPGLSKGDEENIDESRNQALLHYTEENYLEAARNFAAIISPTEEDQFYQALSLLYAEKYSEAVDVFKIIKVGLASDYQQEINWYLALGLIQTGRMEEARMVLQNIKEGEWQAEAAGELLGHLIPQSLD